MIFAFAPIVGLLLGISAITVPWDTLFLSVVLYIVISAVHSYLILAYSDYDKVSMSVGFYYMANAGGRLAGTMLSGWIYQIQGLTDRLSVVVHGVCAGCRAVVLQAP